VAEVATRRVRQEMQQAQAQTLEQVNPLIQQAMEHQRIASDMYSTYPELDQYRQYVVAAAQQLQAVHPTWTPDYRDAIAEKIAPMVPGLFQKIQANRAQRGVAAQVPQYQPPQIPQALPQPQQPTALPPGVQPVAIAGGVHGQPQPVAQAPMLARDAMGNYVTVQQPAQPYSGSPQVRAAGDQVDQQLSDIWNTLGYQ
jgi:hypothetical protein